MRALFEDETLDVFAAALRVVIVVVASDRNVVHDRADDDPADLTALNDLLGLSENGLKFHLNLELKKDHEDLKYEYKDKELE